MENIFSNDGFAAVAACNSQKGWLLFFVDGNDVTAKNITQILESLSTFLKENKFVVLSTPHQSDLHLQFEAIYGTTATNSITFVANGGAAFLRWTGTENLEGLIKKVAIMSNRLSSESGEFGYPAEVCLRELVQQNASEEKEGQYVGAVGVHESVETGTVPAAKLPTQSSVGKTHTGNAHPPVKKPPAQPRDKTVLQIRSPDGLSMTETFRTGCLLSEVRDMIARHFSLTDRFGLATSFPRYHYVSQDYNRSLDELNLWPNAVLMIVPAAPGDVSGNTSLQNYTGSIASWVYNIITYVWSRVRSIFSSSDRNTSQAAANSIVRQSDSHSGPSTSRRQGNIRTLKDTKKDDDKRKTTYNGNSTQQL